MKPARLLVAAPLALGVLFISASAARTDDITPAIIFQNHAKAVGYSLSDGNAKPYVLEMRETWVDTKGGNYAEISVVKQAGPVFREDDQYAGSSTSSGFDGTVFWETSDNGNITIDRGYGRPFDVTDAVILSEGYGPSVPAEMHDVTASAYVVRIHPVDGVPADVYFDKTTWLVDQVIVDPDGDSIREEYADYQPFGPVQVATTRRINQTTVKVTKFTWGAPLTGDDLSAPTGKDYVTFPASGSVTVPFDPHGGVIVEGSINGVSAKFVVETWTPGILVDQLLAQKAGLIKPHTDARFAFDNPEDVAMIPNADIRIGDLKLDKVRVGVWSDNFYFPDEPYDGYLGLDLLAKAVTSIDFDTRTVTFTNPAIFKAPTDWTTLPIALDYGKAQVIAFANGTQKTYMQLGLDFQGRLYFWRSFLKIHPEIAYQAGGFGGIVSSFKLGPYEQTQVGATSVAFPPGYSFNTGGNGIIGQGVLDAFDLTIDYPDSMLYIKPTKSSGG